MKIHKKDLINEVHKITKIDKYIVESTINILFIEIVNSLSKFGEFSIFNFFELKVYQNQRKYFDIIEKKIKLSKSKKLIKFILNEKIKDIIHENKGDK